MLELFKQTISYAGFQHQHYHSSKRIPIKLGLQTSSGKSYATDLRMAFSTTSLVGKAGIAPLSITVNAPQALANLRASLNCFSFYEIKQVEVRCINAKGTSCNL